MVGSLDVVSVCWWFLTSMVVVGASFLPAMWFGGGVGRCCYGFATVRSFLPLSFEAVYDSFSGFL